MARYQLGELGDNVAMRLNRERRRFKPPSLQAESLYEFSAIVIQAIVIQAIVKKPIAVQAPNMMSRRRSPRAKPRTERDIS